MVGTCLAREDGRGRKRLTGGCDWKTRKQSDQHAVSKVAYVRSGRQGRHYGSNSGTSPRSHATPTGKGPYRQGRLALEDSGRSIHERWRGTYTPHTILFIYHVGIRE